MIYTISYQTPIRLDRFLKQQYELITQGVVQKALRSNQVRVNEKKIKEASFRLNNGDILEVGDFFEQYRQIEQVKPANESVKALGQKILQQYLLFENADFIAINKPAKIASQGGTSINISIDQALKALNVAGVADYKLVHRLDKETSGVMLIAKSYDAAVSLTGAFRDKKVYKAYLALAQGQVIKEQGMIYLDDEVTGYKLIQYFPATNISYLEFKPITGKEHQIRRHALELGVHIIGDKKYGDKDSKEPYMLLHSQATKIDSSVFGQEFEFKAPLPGYFKKFL